MTFEQPKKRRPREVDPHRESHLDFTVVQRSLTVGNSISTFSTWYPQNATRMEPDIQVAGGVKRAANLSKL